MKRAFTTMLITLSLLCGYALWFQSSARMATLQSAANVIYVVPGGTGDGSSWANGKDLAAALADAVRGDEVWVKAGTYKPSIAGLADPRAATFALVSGVALYGGFAGGETVRSQRNADPATNGTVLSGDFNGDDVVTYSLGSPNFANNGENAYRVVIAEGTDSATRLDGFTIRGGYDFVGFCYSGDCNRGRGGGIFINGGSPALTNLVIKENWVSDGGGIYILSGSPTLTNVTLTLNRSRTGGGLFASGSDVTLTNVTISSNASQVQGGGLRIAGGRTTLTNVIVRDNFVGTSIGGGGMSVEGGETTMTNVVFAGNYVRLFGTGVPLREGGGGLLLFLGSQATLTNVIFSGNYAPRGGGLFNERSTVTLTNVTFSGNSSAEDYELGGFTGGALYNGVDATATLRNCILWGNARSSGPLDEIANDGSVTVSNSIVRGDYLGTNVLDVDPQFVRPVPVLPFFPPVADVGDLRLQATSPAINAGDNSVSNPALPATDLDGNPRVVGGTVDMGAYELPANTAPTIAATAVTRTAGTPASNAQLATVSDAQDAENMLSVTATPVSGSGVTLSGISVDTSGNVTANVAASCTATTSTFTLQVTDSGTLSATATLTVTVNPNQLPVLSYPSNPGTSYGTGITVNPTNGPSDDLGVTSVVVQSLTPTNPGGITVNSSGVVTVANNVPAGNYTVTIRANAACANKDASFTLGIVKAPLTVTINNASRNQGEANPPFSGTITGQKNGDVITASYSTTATIGSAPGTYPITALLNDPNNRLGNYQVTNTPGTLTILNSCGITVNPALLPQPTLGQAYVQVLSASPTGSYAFSLLDGTLPPGLQIVNVLGIYSLRGTPTTRGTYTFTLKASKNNSTCAGGRSYTLSIP